MPDVFAQMQKDLYDGNAAEVKAATEQALEDGSTPEEILSEGLVAGMDIVGRDFRAGDLFIPEVLIAAKAMHAGMNVLRPLLTQSEASGRGKVVIGTVAGDLHDIGKNLVSMMLEGGGFEVIDLGTDVKPETFIENLQSEGAGLLGMSALLTTTMPQMKNTIEALQAAGIRDQIKVMVGGAPVTEDFAKDIGADAYASDAAEAVDKARALIA